MSTEQFADAFAQLKQLLTPYAARLDVTADQPYKYHLYGAFHPKFKRAIYFGGVEIKKNYVSFHLMPVYTNPELLKTVSVELRKRMQGKSCFNFTSVEPAVLAELKQLAARGFDVFAPQFIPAPAPPAAP
ncbi:MAG TPA: hypothetical protein VFZ04_08755 [Longimicrobiales bacterium]